MESENLGTKSAQQKGMDGDEASDFEVVHGSEGDLLDITENSAGKSMELLTQKPENVNTSLEDSFHTANMSGFDSANASAIAKSTPNYLDDTAGSAGSYHSALNSSFDPIIDLQEVKPNLVSSADFISAELGDSFVTKPLVGKSLNFGGGDDEIKLEEQTLDETMVDTNPLDQNFEDFQLSPQIDSDLPDVPKLAPIEVEPKPAPVEAKPAPAEPKPAPVEVKSAPVEPKPAPVEAKPTLPTPTLEKNPVAAEPKKQPAAVPKPADGNEIKEPMELFCKMGLVGDLVYWRDPKKSGIVFGSGLGVLLSLSFFSLISVIAYLSLLALTVTICYRIYKNVLQAVQKTSDGHPFKDILELDLTLPQDKVREVTDIAVAHVNAALLELRRLFLVEDLVDSIKFGVLLWCLTYLGAWFNGMTLIIIAFVAMFTLPKVYENNKSQIDQNLDIVRAKLADISAKVKAAVPIGKKPAAEEKKEQ